MVIYFTLPIFLYPNSLVEGREHLSCRCFENMKTPIAVYSSNNSANGLERIYIICFACFFLLILILFNLFIASWSLGVTFCVIKTML